MENKKITTLCIVHQGDKVLLGMKKRGFGAGRWNGFGGKVLPEETIEDAAKREMFEEAGIELQDMEKIGKIDFCWDCKPDMMEVNFFRSRNFIGTPEETEEMKPQWFDARNIPYEKMWQDDKHWMPLFLQGKKFKGRFLFDKDDNILEKELNEALEI